jgi:hypothetical protein
MHTAGQGYPRLAMNAVVLQPQLVQERTERVSFEVRARRVATCRRTPMTAMDIRSHKSLQLMIVCRRLPRCMCTTTVVMETAAGGATL